MAEIEEIPIEPGEPTDNIEEVAKKGDDIQENTVDIPKKGRGRPPGAKNKPKPAPKPAPKPKPKAKKKPLEYEAEYEEVGESEEEEVPQPRSRRPPRAARPPELDRHALASEVLGILQQQRYQRTNARRSHYASWFENMS